MVLPAASPLGSVLGAHIQALAAAAANLTQEAGSMLADGSVRLVAACLGANARAQEETNPYRAAAAGQAVRNFIDANVTAPALGPDMLIRQFGLSRAVLYRLFMEDGGVAAYIQNRRLRRCFLTITDPTQPRVRTGDIAHAHGFTSDAQFSRAFRRAFGMTPSEARAEARAGDQGGVVPNQATFINDWMRGLRPRTGQTQTGTIFPVA